ncbi:MAG: TonB-dependent receptor, partial [Ignavibacteriae bacterium]|nr:TonB-dependent receptor [Ignavibacteriota bacterium]
MKKILVILILINSLAISQSLKVSGKVVDGKTGLPLEFANVIIVNTQIGTSTDKNGLFAVSGNYSDKDSLGVSFLGYKPKKILIADYQISDKLVQLEIVDYKLKSIIVNGIIAKEGITPSSFSKINRKEIEENYTIQDVPEYLSTLPSVTSYSENGNGIGYNYLSIRGFDQRRISISVNGIPQNDPEDHNIYWLDMPDLLESTELVQVQRGAGAGAIGFPSIGGSINIITSPFSDKPNFEFGASVGSYNTRKYSAKFSSGLIDNKYSIYAKLSKTLSDGYRDNSWVDFNSYHISAARYDKNITTQINLFGGPVSDGLAFYGLPKAFIKDKDLRKTNFVLPREVEEFSQPHYEILNEIKLSNDLKINNAVFLVIGKGYFDYDGSWSIYYDDYFRLKENGFDSTHVPTNSLIRAEVNNVQYGVIPKLTWEHANGTLISGLEYRNHRSKHWGNIRFAENIPNDVPQNYQYYYYEGGKNIVNFFINENYNLTENLNLLGEVQLSYHEYKLFNEKYLGNDFSIDGLYLNPRIGANYKFDNSINSYVSFAKVTREPRLKNYYDAAESSGGATPQFESNLNGVYDFNNPLVKPETMYDVEVGARYASDRFNFNLNLFYMLFNDEIVSQGQLDRFGQPITGNVDKSIHTGIEIESNVKITNNIEFIFNSGFSKNYISNGSTFINSTDVEGNEIVREIDLTNNSIAGFPSLTVNAIVRGSYHNFDYQITGKY